MNGELFDAVTEHEKLLAAVVGPNEAKRQVQPLFDLAWRQPATPSTPGLREALERLTKASRNFIVVRYRYVNGTDGGRTDEQMDAATEELLDATEAGYAVLTSTEGEPE